MVFRAGFTVQALLGHDQVVFIERWSLDTSGLYGRLHCTSTIGTRPSGLYREMVPGYKWSFIRQVSLYNVCSLYIILYAGCWECSGSVLV